MRFPELIVPVAAGSITSTYFAVVGSHGGNKNLWFLMKCAPRVLLRTTNAKM